jgi:hypothetical protein
MKRKPERKSQKAAWTKIGKQVFHQKIGGTPVFKASIHLLRPQTTQDLLILPQEGRSQQDPSRLAAR